jgi:hypothetical protein
VIEKGSKSTVLLHSKTRQRKDSLQRARVFEGAAGGQELRVVELVHLTLAMLLEPNSLIIVKHILPLRSNFKTTVKTNSMSRNPKTLH